MARRGLATPGRRFIQVLFFLLYLLLFFYYGWPYRVDYTGDNVDRFTWLKLFLLLDPLVAVSASIAARAAIGSLTVAAAVLLTGMLVPRWFCSYVCPMGTVIDVVDGSINCHVRRFRLNKRGWWVNVRFVLLAGVLGAAVWGVLLSGYVAAIPVLTRGWVFLFAPLQWGWLRQWSEVPPFNAGHYFSMALFLIIPALGLLRPRFWCAYLCPSGALLSLPSAFSLVRRKVNGNCTQCGKCLRGCSFDAIAQDYSSRSLSCTTCKSCQRICPVQSIEFSSRFTGVPRGRERKDTRSTSSCTRRHFFLGAFGATGMGMGVAAGLAHERKTYRASYAVRPPGSMPESRFRAQCIRCGQCMRICPSHVLQPAGFELGMDGLWTPVLKMDFSGCQPLCHSCGQVCPTGAIRKLPLDEKRAARLGLALISTRTCLPHCQKEACGLCVDACSKAGYHAIEYVRIGIEYDNQGMSIKGTGFLAPVVMEGKCVGCGLCQTRCHAVNVVEKNLLTRSAIEIMAGPGKEDRIVSGSYRELANRRQKKDPPKVESPENEYLPDFLQ